MQNIDVLNILLCEQDLANKQEIIEDFCQQGYVPMHFVRKGAIFDKVKQEITPKIEGELLEIAQFVRFPETYCT